MSFPKQLPGLICSKKKSQGEGGCFGQRRAGHAAPEHVRQKARRPAWLGPDIWPRSWLTCSSFTNVGPSWQGPAATICWTLAVRGAPEKSPARQFLTSPSHTILTPALSAIRGVPPPRWQVSKQAETRPLVREKPGFEPRLQAPAPAPHSLRRGLCQGGETKPIFLQFSRLVPTFSQPQNTITFLKRWSRRPMVL